MSYLDGTPPTLRLLSLGAGVQSSALLLLSALGHLPKLDGAIFADTGWEPAEVYTHLDRLVDEVAAPAEIPVYRVSNGNLRHDAVTPGGRYASLPLFVKNPDGTEGMTRRQCTKEYKLQPIKSATRKLLGYPHPTPVPRGVWVETWIGISTDEADRAERRPDDVKYAHNRFPLLEAGLNREQCRALLTRHGFANTPKSACVGCSYHTNAQWRRIRDERPEQWADAVEFDRQMRKGGAAATAKGQLLRGEAFLHRSRVPLEQAPIDRVGSAEWRNRQTDLVALLDLEAFEETLDADAVGGCSPYACVSGEDTPDGDDDDTIDVDVQLVSALVGDHPSSRRIEDVPTAGTAL